MATVKLSSFGPKRQFVGTDGLPLVGYWLFFYVGGSVNTKQNTYTTSIGDVANPNPIQLNALGEVPNEVYFIAGATYKAFLEPPDPSNPGVPIDPPTSGQTLGDFLQGINDTTVTADQWVAGPAPTFLNATQFTLAGDQTSIFQVGRRLRFTVTAGTVYGTITVSAFAALTTVTVVLDSGVLDSGLSAVSYGLLSATNPSLPAIITGIANARVTYPAGIPSILATGPGTRQTVQYGPVDASGFSAFGGATGTTTVTASGILIVSAAFGGATNGPNDRIGSITNPSWTGLATNGTMYLYIDVAADGTCTTGSGTLAPAYQWGGAYSVVANQFTFNIQEMTAKVGAGAVANQAYRVYVGEVTVAGAVVTAIVWYALMGRYDSGYTNTLPGIGVQTSLNHNIGVDPGVKQFYTKNLTAEGGYSIGDVALPGVAVTSTTVVPVALPSTSKAISFTAGAFNAFFTTIKNTGAGLSMTAANWAYRVTASRGW